jgi:hypothetical protein
VATTRTEDGHNRLPKQTLQYKPNDEVTQGDRRRDGGTNIILRIKEQEIRLNLHEHDDGDDDDDDDDDDFDDDISAKTSSPNYCRKIRKTGPK